ncbi:MAG: DinB family protein, partial [Planctomycetota bacterium]
MTQTAATVDIEPIRALPVPDLIDRYALGVHAIDTRLLTATDEQASAYFRPGAGIGRWSCRALVVHLADAEQVMVHRMRRTVCEDRPLLAVWDQEAFIDACVCDAPATSADHPAPAPPVAGAVGVIHATRLWTRDWLSSLPGDAFDRVALHPESGELTLR